MDQTKLESKDKRDELDDARVLEVTAKIGEMLLQSGAEIFRIEDTMQRVSDYYGVPSSDFFVLSNGIFTTGGEKHNYAKVRVVPVKPARLDKVVALNQLSREIVHGYYTLEEVEQKLQEIEKMPEKRFLTRILSSGIGAAGFCCLFDGSVMDGVAAFIAGALVCIFMVQISNRYLSKITGTICCAALSALICMLCLLSGIGNDLNHMVLGAVMPLVPGVAFLNGIREIVDSDYLAGSVRLLDAILGFVCIGLGVGIVFGTFGGMLGGM